jgi:hypothetical protein
MGELVVAIVAGVILKVLEALVIDPAIERAKRKDPRGASGPDATAAPGAEPAVEAPGPVVPAPSEMAGSGDEPRSAPHRDRLRSPPHRGRRGSLPGPLRLFKRLLGAGFGALVAWVLVGVVADWLLCQERPPSPSRRWPASSSTASPHVVRYHDPRRRSVGGWDHRLRHRGRRLDGDGRCAS